ncbi:MAG: glycosyltransferase [Chitinophagia bacterium]|nr:glycosyltransferase [Chitinophagia bacterium]
MQQPIHQRNWRMYMKYFFIQLYNRNTDYYIVQTPHMVAELMKTGLKKADKCLTIPFYNADKYTAASTPFSERPADQFAFVSTPSPQKNYPTLLAAWEYLHEQGHTPGLHITIDNTAPELLARIDEMKAKGIQIFNYSYIDPRELYFKYRYLVCPSVTESFGLPLIEAVESGMKVLAPDLPYVYDVIQPSATFNPLDRASIGQAVIKAMQQALPTPAIVTHNEVAKLINLIFG